MLYVTSEKKSGPKKKNLLYLVFLVVANAVSSGDISLQIFQNISLFFLLLFLAIIGFTSVSFSFFRFFYTLIIILSWIKVRLFGL